MTALNQFIERISPTAKIVYLNVSKDTHTAEIVSCPTYDPDSYFEIQSYLDRRIKNTESFSKKIGRISSEEAKQISELVKQVGGTIYNSNGHMNACLTPE